MDLFYVGCQGQFDALVLRTLRKLKQQYPQIQYAVVLAYMPGKGKVYDHDWETMLPEGIEAVYPRYAIAWRNDWMLHQSDFVVTYITHGWGGAAKYAQKGVRAGKRIIPLGTQEKL